MEDVLFEPLSCLEGSREDQDVALEDVVQGWTEEDELILIVSNQMLQALLATSWISNYLRNAQNLIRVIKKKTGNGST